MRNKIEKTPIYKSLTAKTPFLKTLLTNKQTVSSVERIIYQINRFGSEYVEDKNYCKRDLQIAKEILSLENKI